ncbi:putative melanocortin-2 receptor accessory protein [Scophthalmus maximus]|uniref:Putative melanocortin-2 receptor accessory protein n=1 Tax=Scophthalmus maximus TaxID=52904 RepID=A0A2U9B415_SCOMX|nr:putative melanocortin-2 receptor accessory protein [Scophthalmus maximus]KAF0030089.1 hypothetical protein F2P81_016820 [Scophthalmus maximus]
MLDVDFDVVTLQLRRRQSPEDAQPVRDRAAVCVAFLTLDHTRQTMAATENSTSTVSYEWEYYYDYLDPVIVDGSKLQYNKYSIVIIFWIFLAAFVGFLFLFLNLMSSSGNYSMSHSSKIKGSHRISTA